MSRAASIPVSSLPSLPYGTPLTGSAATLWAAAILSALRAPINTANVTSLIGWFHNEGGGGANNPMNTTLPTSASTSSFGVGVQNYSSPSGGVSATAQTLLGGYPAIVAALRSGKGLANTSGATAKELSKWSGGGYSSITPMSSSGSVPSNVTGISRPGGAGAATATSYPVPSSQGITQSYSQLLGATGSASSDPTYVDDRTIGGRASGVLDAILSPLKWALGQEKQGYDELHNLINAPAKAADDVSHVSEDGWKILESLPWYTLRLSEFTSGIAMIVFGIYLSFKNRSSGGPARAARTVLSYTPAGRAVEARKFTRIGTREGRQEHYRLQGRRSERARLSSQQAEKIQSAGKASRNTNNT